MTKVDRRPKANILMGAGLLGVPRVPLAKALNAPTTHRHNFVGNYVADLQSVVDMQAVRSAGVKVGIDPLERGMECVTGSRSSIGTRSTLR